MRIFLGAVVIAALGASCGVEVVEGVSGADGGGGEGGVTASSTIATGAGAGNTMPTTQTSTSTSNTSTSTSSGGTRADGASCSSNDECASNACISLDNGRTIQHVFPSDAHCAEPTCHDTVADGTEQDIDCGGPCLACIGDPCASNDACATGVCDGGACSPVRSKAVSVGNQDACVLLASGSVDCWGRNLVGAVGDNSTPSLRLTAVPVVDLPPPVDAISAGTNFACAISAGALHCWGMNTFGQIGDGSTTDRYAPVPVTGLDHGVATVSAGSSHACALTTSGGVLCWGDNARGELGDGTTTPRATPAPVSGLGSGVVAVIAGAEFTCATLATGGVMCWGKNDTGQLGTPPGADVMTPADVPGFTTDTASLAVGWLGGCVIRVDGSVGCWGTPATPPSLAAPHADVTSLSLGSWFGCAIDHAGDVACWGRSTTDGGSQGNLGDGANIPSSADLRPVVGLPEPTVAVAAGFAATCALSVSGWVRCWGSIGPLGDGGAHASDAALPAYGLAPP